MEKFYQQGDVLLVLVTNTNDGPSKHAKFTGRVVQPGRTGNTHKVNKGGRVYEYWNDKFLVVDKNGCTLSHEEHDDIILPEGTYHIQIVREFDPFSKEQIRQVID